MSRPTLVAFGVVAALVALLALLHRLGMGVAILLVLLLALVAGAAIAMLPWHGVRLLDELEMQLRAFRWGRDEGRHHAFGGVSLGVNDDGRHVWLDGADLQRVLRTRDPEDVLAARHAGRWQRDERGRLMLRVDAVVEHLAAAPGRMEPRTVRLRRYLEREILFPARERQRRAN